MIFKNSQQNFELNLDNSIKKVSYKVSGGADSAIVGYMLSKYVSEQRPDIKIYPVTIIHPNKPFQEIYSKRVLNFLKEEFGNIFGEHYIDTCKDNDDYRDSQKRIIAKLRQEHEIGARFAGITANPPPEVYSTFLDFKGKVADPPEDPRDRVANKKPQFQYDAYLPLVNVDKKGVAEYYDTFNVRDTLYPLTRSCEAFDKWKGYDINNHCKSCWFCQERFWGFGSYT